MASMTALVSANGRIFYIMDEGPRSAILLPAKWSLIARDAFNGTILWKRPIEEWNTSLWPLKSGPNQLPRRLVAVGDRVYLTLGIDAPLTALDAATGETIRTYENTKYTEEVLASDGVLFLLVSQSPNKWKEYRPKHTYVWDNTRRANSEWAWDQAPRRVMAVQADTGRALWQKPQRVAPLTLTADREHVYLYDGEKALCLDRRNGSKVWASEPIVRKQPFPTGYGPTLVVQDDVVLLSVENKSMTAFSAATGKKLWSAEHHRGGHASPDDMLVIGGLVWSGEIADGKGSGVFTGRDLHTGEVKREFKPDVDAYWFHHRCYRSKATDRFIMTSRTGIEFVDLAAKHWTINHWVRGGCLYGVMPCNGLVYAPPHACGCYLESKLFGFNALAPARRDEGRGARDEGVTPLERGPAYDTALQNPKSKIQNQDDWPTYRHDAMRSGSMKTSVSTDLKLAWQTDLAGKLSSVVVAGGKVYVASVDAHTVHALDADTGKVVWSYTAGARVDSPPTIYEDRVLFGSADGWVYCLRADDGRLTWRFRAAPDERRLMAFEQLESPWPVSGSVLVQGDVAYCVAGRSAFLDGGMRLLRLDAKTGRKLSETLLDDRDPASADSLQKYIKGLDMPVALPDVLSSDGRYVYMRAQRFDLKGVRQEIPPIDVKDQTGEGVHLFSRSGFLDDAWWHRSFWMYGKGVSSGYGGWFRPGAFVPTGRLIVFDDALVYAFDRKPESMCNASVYEYYLYAADRQVTPEGIQRIMAATGRINRSSTKKAASSSDWALRKKFSLSELTAANFKWAEGNPPLQAHAMVLADKTLFVAGPPDVVDEEKIFKNPDDPAIKARMAEQVAALEGKKGSQLWAFAAADGKRLAAYEMDSMPVFDGMAAADGRLYMAMADGKVVCLAAEGAPLKPAPDAKLAPMDTSVKTTAGPPSAAGDFAKVVQAEVTRSDLGYLLTADAKKVGLALKKLDTPLQGKATFKFKLQSTPGGESGRTMRNGFLVFGDTPDEAALVKCGLRFAMKSAVIVQGPINGGKAVAEKFEMDPERVYDIAVTLDLVGGQVTMKTGGHTVSAKLAQPPKSISYIGYCALNAVTDFSPISVSGE
jgi:outer membrane protein assembly factor BamB